MNHPDFYEGVRAVIIEKDNKPNWLPKDIKDVSQQQICNYFLPFNL